MGNKTYNPRDYVTCPRCGRKCSLLKLHIYRAHPGETIDLTNVPTRSDFVKTHHKTMHKKRRFSLKFYKMKNYGFQYLAIPKEQWPSDCNYINLSVDKDNNTIKLIPSKTKTKTSKTIINKPKQGYFLLAFPDEIIEPIKSACREIKLEGHIITIVFDGPELLRGTLKWFNNSKKSTSHYDLRVYQSNCIYFADLYWPDNAEFVVPEFTKNKIILTPLTRFEAFGRGSNSIIKQPEGFKKHYKIQLVGKSRYMFRAVKFISENDVIPGPYVFKKLNANGSLIFQSSNRHYSKLPVREFDLEEFNKELAEFDADWEG